jgi:formylglycine-generating enzyme required for sulfatase activity
MAKSVKESALVLLVCTPNFAQKADAGGGGVGYETAIVTGEIFTDEARENKFVPLLREGSAKESLPSYLKSRLFVDFRENASFENRIEELLRHFFGEPLYPTPDIGPRPQFRTTPPSAARLSKPTLQREITNSIGMEFILISAGSFTMGSNTSCDYERPPHKVEISQPFYLQTTEITQGQWKRVMGDNPSHFKNCGDDCPVEPVSWGHVQNFIKKLNQIEKTTEYRLPSEAEWEYACRAGSDDEFSFGDDTARLKEFGW